MLGAVRQFFHASGNVHIQLIQMDEAIGVVISGQRSGGAAADGTCRQVPRRVVARVTAFIPWPVSGLTNCFHRFWLPSGHAHRGVAAASPSHCQWYNDNKML